MANNSLKGLPRTFQVGRSTISRIGLARLFIFLRGAMILGVFLAFAYRGFLGRHAGLALMFGFAYVGLCAIGAYFKIQQSKLSSTNSS
jgi:hypothetical protein